MLWTGAHIAGLGYYVWLLRFVFELRPDGRGDPTVLQQYVDFRPKYLSVWGLVSASDSTGTRSRIGIVRRKFCITIKLVSASYLLSSLVNVLGWK